MLIYKELWCIAATSKRAIHFESLASEGFCNQSNCVFVVCVCVSETLHVAARMRSFASSVSPLSNPVLQHVLLLIFSTPVQACLIWLYDSFRLGLLIGRLSDFIWTWTLATSAHFYACPRDTGVFYEGIAISRTSKTCTRWFIAIKLLYCIFLSGPSAFPFMGTP